MLQLKQLTKLFRLSLLWNVTLVLTVSLIVNWFSMGTARADQDESVKVEDAKKEGIISLYTTITVNAAQKLFEGFSQKYPFIRTELYRSGSDRLLTKILTEARVRKYIPDVYLSDTQDSHIIKSAGLVRKYISPEGKVYAQEFKDPDGFWISSHIITRVLAYNTKLVPPRDVPKRYEDLLDPKWKGKLGMPSDEIAWFAGQLKIMGREKGIDFMKKLSRQNIQFRTGKTLLTQLLAAGEFSIAVLTNGDIVEALKRNGAAVEWVGIEPVITTLMPLMVAAHAPHPNAAMLFVDYVLSKEGQEIIRSVNRIPIRPDVLPNPPRLIQGLKLLHSDPAWSGKEYVQLYREIFSKK